MLAVNRAVWAPRPQPGAVSAALFQRALFQQTVNFDFASSAGLQATIRDQRDDEAGGQRGAIPRTVLLGRINRLAELGGVECIEDGWAIIGAIP